MSDTCLLLQAICEYIRIDTATQYSYPKRDLGRAYTLKYFETTGPDNWKSKTETPSYRWPFDNPCVVLYLLIPIDWNIDDSYRPLIVCTIGLKPILLFDEGSILKSW